jgi:hypothetical protein
MSSKPFRFLDLPKEIRDIIYRRAVICRYPGSSSPIIRLNNKGAVGDSKVRQAVNLFRVSKFFAAEAMSIFFGAHLFQIVTISSATTFTATIGKHKASQIKMLHLKSMTYTKRETRQIACCTASAVKITAKNLGNVYSGLEVLYLSPEQDSQFVRFIDHPTTFDSWTDDAFVATKALALAFPWLKYIKYRASVPTEIVRMSSMKERPSRAQVWLLFVVVPCEMLTSCSISRLILMKNIGVGTERTCQDENWVAQRLHVNAVEQFNSGRG